MKKASTAPSADLLRKTLGPANPAWRKLLASVAAEWGAMVAEWKPSKLWFGRICVLKSRQRTLAYLIPAAARFEVCVVLGERAVVLALESDLPDQTKVLIAAARPYVEGRGIRFMVSGIEQVRTVVRLIALKVTPK